MDQKTKTNVAKAWCAIPGDKTTTIFIHIHSLGMNPFDEKHTKRDRKAS